ncbi:hypothetical protein MKZ08_04145 [Viridibacillus sp. FSL R5-0477]|uniref:Uncharacterized protein n=1 Tax=Viridibacillus arenosi FSL R5-213 TaxID=1227360 RepID=W4EMW9_9BACL|nr:MULTISPECIES: hypothetical protein [Viridibacillus]ETT81923.1 hypothetical protein C176_17166 [Viridibacillus arenosi FSL R5-213]OMC81494.1 hypothetical protein BK130_15210 [Viridibacillus sp. FSL H8-0123]OMC86980.1 hypothetical protein BK128_09970 [Viridibacillus sp. FSL H7-0596]OMC90542.1 hypothetical protein BK137_13250 [Viridibacillus arenosi]
MKTWVLNEFLYFPEDKSEYLPAAIELAIILVLCVAVFFTVKKMAKKQELKTKMLEEEILQNRQQDAKQNQSN